MASRQQSYYSQVYETARNLGANEVQARLAASQASLETGYGKSVKGNNHFGIKAGGKYKGKTVNFATHEVYGGKRVGITDKFRAYDGLAGSVKGYLEFMEKAYPKSWNAPDFQSAARNLKNGRYGSYATDPKYTSKLNYISDRFGGEQAAPSPALAYNNQSLPTGSQTPTPWRPQPVLPAPRGIVWHGGGLDAPKRTEVASLSGWPIGKVERQPLERARPAIPANKTAALLQRHYQSKPPSSLPAVPVGRVTRENLPPARPTVPLGYSAGAYKNYQMGAPVLETPGYVDPLVSSQPQAPIIEGPAGQPLDIIPTVPIPASRPTRMDRFKHKAGAHLKEQLKPQTLAARALGGLLLGPVGAQIGPKVAQFANRRMNNGQGFNFGFNRSSQSPSNTFNAWGSNGSQRVSNVMNGNGGGAGAIANSRNYVRTQRADGRYDQYNKQTGKTSIGGDFNHNQSDSSFLSSIFG
ncbi:glucosaminidase domain-containing protein [Lentilitoribacter sp. Alg239-R112]|uniref:glycoside hydrolase family 73 protein n=1 Tax=Lentilitoribacter sp. Alg239-R112 TaxID=2305987 RepID=UPI0013A6A879|nr:glucosaminidase domain-containing protein [Lentilitoribacter sp. Alg239-R112]